MSRSKIIQSMLENKNAPSFSEKAIEEIKQYFKDESLEFSPETSAEIVRSFGKSRNLTEAKKIMDLMLKELNEKY